MNRGMSSTVATVFLVMITVGAVGILWGVVFPFIKNEVDLDNYDVRLDIVTEKGYTVYDSSTQFAMVQVKRSQDDATLSGMEIFMDFEGTGYKTTLRAPGPGSVRRYVFNLSDLDPRAPGYTSVAPIFSERGREFVGTVTSNLLMPQAKISLNITELVLDLGTDGNNDTFVVILDEDLTEVDYSGCQDGEREDPWGGCAFHSSVMSETINAGQHIATIGIWDSEISNSKYVKFYEGSDGCINSSQAGDCTVIDLSSAGTSQFSTSPDNALLVSIMCSDSVAYFYDSC